MTLSKEKIEYFKKKLMDEKDRLEEELSQVAKKNPDAPGDWEATPGDLNVDPSDPNDMADTFEELENRSAIEDSLEDELESVDAALERIKKGKYGFCIACKEAISEDRLKANPSAGECMKHA